MALGGESQLMGIRKKSQKRSEKALEDASLLGHIHRRSGELSVMASWAGYSTLAFVLRMAADECQRLGNGSPTVGSELGRAAPLSS